MKYFESAMTISFTKTCINKRTINLIRWVGFSIYTTGILVAWILSMSLFPGFLPLDNFFRWYDGCQAKIFKQASTFWLTINVSSTVLTIFSIRKILATTKKLQKGNKNVTINKHTMLLHSGLLVLQCLVLIVYALQNIEILHKRWQLINILSIVVDVTV